MRAYFQNGTRLEHAKGTYILTTEKEKEATYYIADGFVRIYSQTNRGEQYTHIIYGPGEIFPVTWLARAPRSKIMYETLSDTVLYSVPITRLSDDMLKNPKLSYGVLQQTIEQYRIYTMRVDNLEYKYASERLAYRLILLANRFGIKTDQGTVIKPVMTHQLIGTSLNLSRESVSREMEKLVRKGLVAYNAVRQIVVIDIAQLSKELRVPHHQGLTSKHPLSPKEL
jgi:CRP-like cAMP-binding protein